MDASSVGEAYERFDEAHLASISGTAFPPVSTPVLIVGGGPVGLLCSIFLARYRINSIVVERHIVRLGQPKSHVVNPRSLEILRQFGLDTKRIRSLAAPIADCDVVRFATSMSGLELGSIPFDVQGEKALAFTPEPLVNIAQPILEEYLREVAIRTGMVTIWGESQWQSSETVDGFELSTILSRRTNAVHEYRSKYLLCCDGANARSREKLQIPFNAIEENTEMKLYQISIHINADLRKFKSGTLWWIWSLSQVGTFISYDRGSSWVYVMTYDPLVSPVSTFTEEFCRSQIDQAIGEKVQYDILSMTHWISNTKVADFYRSKTHPGAFVLGDAAHAFPPTGGLGINTGIADAQNLIWKIQAVENKWTDNSLLDSYNTERRPIAIANALQSAVNRTKIRRLVMAVFGPKKEDPEVRVKDPKTRQEIEEGILDQSDHFNSVNLQLGYIYGDGGRSTRGSCDIYIPSFAPGARLPHAWIQRNGLRCSTLDLVDGSSFVLLLSSKFTGASGASGSQHQTGPRKIPVQFLCEGVDFKDENGKWTSSAGLDQALGLLIRPDQHIVGTIQTLDELNKLEETLGTFSQG